MTLKSMSLCTMRLHLDIGCAFNESSAVGSLLKYRVIVNSPLMSCGMISSPLYSSLSCSITLFFGCMSSSYRAYLATRRNSAFLSALISLLGGSWFFSSSILLLNDGASEKWSRLGTNGASEKHLILTGDSSLILTTHYDIERDRFLFTSLPKRSYRSTSTFISDLYGSMS